MTVISFRRGALGTVPVEQTGHIITKEGIHEQERS